MCFFTKVLPNINIENAFMFDVEYLWPCYAYHSVSSHDLDVFSYICKTFTLVPQSFWFRRDRLLLHIYDERIVFFYPYIGRMQNNSIHKIVLLLIRLQCKNSLPHPPSLPPGNYLLHLTLNRCLVLAEHNLRFYNTVILTLRSRTQQ